MSRPFLNLLAAVPFLIAGCGHGDQVAKLAQMSQAPATGASATTETKPKSKAKGYAYVPPTAEEMSPLRPEYAAELAKIHEPPEMAGKPLQVRKTALPAMAQLENLVKTVRSLDKATHEQRAKALRELLEFANSSEQDNGIAKTTTYGAIAALACLDGADPHTVIGYATNAIDDQGNALALRARMYLKAGDREKALDDLEKILIESNVRALADPRKESAHCGWSIADFDALGDNPRGLAAKGAYLSSFIGFGSERRGTVKESAIRNLYARAAQSWHSPIPHFLVVTIDGIGSELSMARAGCVPGTLNIPEIVSKCSAYEQGVRQEIRELTMALVIDPTFVPALASRANRYLQLAQMTYADRKPSRKLFEQAIVDYGAALEAGSANRNTLYCDRAIALAAIGRYQDAATSYLQGMKYAPNGVETSPFVYEQLAHVYMRLGKFNEAADLLTQAIMNVEGGGMDVVLFGGGLKSFRTLYPEYDALPDEILADVIRRRYAPQFPATWDADFTSQTGAVDGKLLSSILVELYVMRGDAYVKAGHRAEALADYERVKSDVWSGEEPSVPRLLYFDSHGARNFDLPEPWPGPPPNT